MWFFLYFLYACSPLWGHISPGGNTFYRHLKVLFLIMIYADFQNNLVKHWLYAFWGYFVRTWATGRGHMSPSATFATHLERFSSNYHLCRLSNKSLQTHILCILTDYLWTQGCVHMNPGRIFFNNSWKTFPKQTFMQTFKICLQILFCAIWSYSNYHLCKLSKQIPSNPGFMYVLLITYGHKGVTIWAQGESFLTNLHIPSSQIDKYAP